MLSLDMGWRRLLFANWPVAPETVEVRIPDALSVDTYDGRAWLSVVPFVNVDVRPRRIPAGFGFRLPELNLRTYVTPDRESSVGDSSGSRDSGDDSGGRDDASDRESGVPAADPGVPADDPGVYFFSLDADGLAGAGLLGVVGARLFHHLPYYYADIDCTVEDAETDCTVENRTVRFESRRRHPGARPVHFSATYGPTGEEFRAECGSLAEFLTERYRYYTEAPDGGLRYADIHHDRWPLYRAEAEIEAHALFRANGFAHPDGDPVCYYSPGVDVLASSSRRWRDENAK